MVLLTLLEQRCRRANIWMVLCLSSRLKSTKGIESFANISGILRWGLGASPAVVSCFNPTFKSGTLHAAHLISRIWIHPQSACSAMISAASHTTTGSTCRRMKSFGQKMRSPTLNAVTRAQLACRSSVRVWFRDGGPLCTIISNEMK